MAKAPTKSEIVAQICKDTKLSRKEVGRVFDSLHGRHQEESAQRRPVHHAGIAEDEGREEARVAGSRGNQPVHETTTTFKAKPASKKVRVLPLKGLKAFVN